MNIDDIKRYFRNFYNQNKTLTYLIVGVLIGVILLNGSVFEAIYNAYLIYLGGTIFKHYLDEKRMLNVLIGGAIVGGLTSFLVFPTASILLILKSAVTSASLALFVGAATYTPNLELMLFFLGKVKLKWIAVALVVLDLASISVTYASEQVGHLAGVIFGFLIIYLGKNHNFTTTPRFLKWFMRPRGPYYKKAPKAKAKRNEDDADYNKRKHDEQAEIDAILDKIKMSGYESLSTKEKQKLFDKSKNG